MKRALISLFAILLSTPVFAQTVANGPYYATPSWDQTLPAAQRFIVLSNFNSQAVLDRETGLVWERAPDTDPRVWDFAQTLCLSKNVGGRKGWKLPSIQELASLIDPTTAGPALPVGHPFIGVQSFNYWSATTATSPTTGTAARTVYFGDGGFSSVLKSDQVFAWCVRGGSGGEIQ